MIEVIHYQNRFGKQFVAVIAPDIKLVTASPAGAEYAQRYAAGLEKPYYPVPAICFYARYDNLINALIEHEERTCDGLT